MKSITRKVTNSYGNPIREKQDMKKLLNLSYLNLTNTTERTGPLDFPIIYCDVDVYPDFLALYTEPGYYHKTKNTAVCFYAYDKTFDGIDGLYNAIIHNDKHLLNYYKKRFSNVHYFISPDYSMFNDLEKMIILEQMWKIRIISLWFIYNLDAVVVPNISLLSKKYLPLTFSGFEKCSVIAFSTKSHINNAKDLILLKDTLEYAINHLPLKTIIVYDGCKNNDNVYTLFKPAIDKGINIIIPNNSLKSYNQWEVSNE